jgi:archaellum component FlaC
MVKQIQALLQKMKPVVSKGLPIVKKYWYVIVIVALAIWGTYEKIHCDYIIGVNDAAVRSISADKARIATDLSSLEIQLANGQTIISGLKSTINEQSDTIKRLGQASNSIAINNGQVSGTEQHIIQSNTDGISIIDASLSLIDQLEAGIQQTTR